MEYLKKYPQRGYVINPSPLNLNTKYQKMEINLDFGTQYSYFEEELDHRFPEPLFKDLEMVLFCNSDHGHDKMTGQLITGIMSVVGSTPATWTAKRQMAVHTSTFQAEFRALKKAVEEAVMMRYQLRLMGMVQ
eukprot:3374267-Ditylum_brightwellii.AAC.1